MINFDNLRALFVFCGINALYAIVRPGLRWWLVKPTVSAPVAAGDIGAVDTALMQRINANAGRLTAGGLASDASAS